MRVERSSAGRAGKTVTIVSGVEGGDAVLDELLRELKTRCGAGGTVKGSAIEIQGDHRERILPILAARGYRPKKSGG